MSVNLAEEFEVPAPVNLAEEFEAPEATPATEAPRPRLRDMAAAMTSGGAFTMPQETTPEQVATASGPVLETMQRQAPTAIRVGVPLAAIPFTGGLSVPAAMAVFGGASLVGDVAAQGMELGTGQRDEFSPAETAINTVVGAVTPGLRAIPKLRPLLAPSRTELITQTGAGTLAKRGAANFIEGAVLGSGQDTAIRAVRGEEITPGTVATSAVLSGSFATALGLGFDEAIRGMTLDRMLSTARAAGYQGEGTVDSLRRWWQQSQGTATPPPPPPPAQIGAAPGSARTEFETRVGMTPPAAPTPSQVPTSGPGAARPNVPPRKPTGGGSTPPPATNQADDEIIYAPWEYEGGLPGTGIREDGTVDWVPPPSPAAAAAIQAATLDTGRFPPVEFPVAEIVVNKDVPQFKGNGNDETGEVEPLTGVEYRRLPMNPITLWQKRNGEVEVITGRHRLGLAKRLGEKTIPSQIVREEDGFTREMALTFDAESNILDGQGEVKDYATYFRTQGDLSRADAAARGLLRGAKGSAGWHLGQDAGDGLFTLYANGQITEGKAVGIARGAPRHEAAQASAIRQAARMSAGELEMYARNLAAMTPDAGAGAASQMGFEGISSDFAAYEQSAAKLAKVQAERMRDNTELIAAAKGAAKNPGAAAKMGLPVNDPAALRARVAQLEADNVRLRNPDPALWAELHQAAGLPPPKTLSPVELDGPANPPPPREDTSTAALFEEADLAQPVEVVRALEVAAKQADKQGTPFELRALNADEIAAEAAALAEQARRVNQRSAIEAGLDAPLMGDSSDVGQGALFDEGTDLLSGPSAESMAPPQPPAPRQNVTASDGGGRRRVAAKLAKQPTPPAADADAVLPPYNPAAPILVRDGRRGTYWPVPLERLDKIPVVQMPELVRLARELTGSVPQVRKLAKALGVFRGGAEVSIQLDPRIFRDPTVAAKVLAHEIGHLADYLPDGTLSRGNILGRIASLVDYKATSLPLDPMSGGQSLTPADRRGLRAQAEAAIGKRPPADEPDERAAWGEAVAGKYAELVQAELESRGLIVARGTERGGTSVVGASKSGVGMREELIGASEYWKPIPEGAPPSYLQYRYSGAELYADAISILLNSPGTLKRIAPTFYEAFFNYLDAKPEVKAALFDVYDLLSKPHLNMLRQRSGDIKAMFVKGDELLMRKAAEREARYGSMRGYWDRFRQELFDIFDPLVKRGAQLERSGTKIPDRYNPRFLFDEHPLADNRNYEMVQRLWEKVVKPVEAAEMTLNDLGEFLFLSRVLNERIVRAEPPRDAVRAWQIARAAALGITDPVRRASAVRDLDRKLSEWDVSQNVGRTGVANPLGTTPETARLGLLRMRLELGAQRMGELERAAKVFHDTVFEQMQAAAEVGAYSQALFESVLVPNRDFYAAFGVLDYLEDYVPASIRMSEGTFKDIANPFTATVLKMVSVNRLIQTQKSKRGTVEFLQAVDPGRIKPAERRFDGKRWVVDAPKDPDKGLLDLLDDGQPVGYHVDKSVAEMFDKLTPAQVSAVLHVLNWPFRNIVYPLIIRYNPAFQLVMGPARDLRRTLVNVPRGKGVKQVGEMVRNYLTFLGLPPTEAGAAVRAYLRGEPNPIIAEMIATQAIGTPLDNFGRDFGRADQMEKILADFGMTPDRARPGKLAEITKPVMSLLKAIEFAGLSFEMLPKVSTYLMLTRELGWSRKEAAYFVRNSVGVPNINRKGRHTNVAEVVFPFFKVFANGLRADARLMRSPKSAGGWWFRWAATDGMWTMLQAAAALGLLGAGLKELYDGISDYNKTNFNVLPVGTTEGGDFGKRVVYVRLPRDETHRLVSGLLYQGMMAAGRSALGEEAGPGSVNPGAVTAFGADQIPGLSPVLEIGMRWAEYLQGENPKDSFRGSPILTNAEWLAGGWPAMKSMLGFTADNMGITNFVRYDSRTNTTAEMVLSATPGLNRFIQSTATGYRERQQAVQKEESAERERLRLSMPDNVQRLIGEYYHLRSVPVALRTLEQTLRMMELARWHGKTYQEFEDPLSVNPGDPMLRRQLEEESQAYERRPR